MKIIEMPDGTKEYVFEPSEEDARRAFEEDTATVNVSDLVLAIMEADARRQQTRREAWRNMVKKIQSLDPDAPTQISYCGVRYCFIPQKIDESSPK